MKKSNQVLLNIKSNISDVKYMLLESSERRAEYAVVNEKIKEYKNLILQNGNFKVSENFKDHVDFEFVTDESYAFIIDESQKKDFCEKLFEVFSNDVIISKFININDVNTVEHGLMYTSLSIMHYFEIERKLIMFLEDYEDGKHYMYDEKIHEGKLEIIKQIASYL